MSPPGRAYESARDRSTDTVARARYRSIRAVVRASRLDKHLQSLHPLGQHLVDDRRTLRETVLSAVVLT
jgi:hypothetical protein